MTKITQPPYAVNSLSENWSKLDWALFYLGLGWYPIPLCCPSPAGACACGRGHEEHAVGKAPLVKNWINLRPGEEQVRRWWEQWPSANIGLLPDPSGLLVLDCDSLQEVKNLLAQGLLNGPLVITGRGYHLYKARPQDVALRNRIHVGDGYLDIIVNMIVAPPSVHRTGTTYRWMRFPATGLQELPASFFDQHNVKSQRSAIPPEIIAEKVTPPTTEGVRGRFVFSLTPSDLSQKLAELAPLLRRAITEGQLPQHPSRSEALYFVVCSLLERGWDEGSVLSILLDPSLGISQKVLEQRQPAEWAAAEIRRAQAKTGSTCWPDRAPKSYCGDTVNNAPSAITFCEVNNPENILNDKISYLPPSPVTHEGLIKAMEEAGVDAKKVAKVRECLAALKHKKMCEGTSGGSDWGKRLGENHRLRYLVKKRRIEEPILNGQRAEDAYKGGAVLWGRDYEFPGVNNPDEVKSCWQSTCKETAKVTDSLAGALRLGHFEELSLARLLIRQFIIATLAHPDARGPIPPDGWTKIRRFRRLAEISKWADHNEYWRIVSASSPYQKAGEPARMLSLKQAGESSFQPVPRGLVRRADDTGLAIALQFKNVRRFAAYGCLKFLFADPKHNPHALKLQSVCPACAGKLRRLGPVKMEKESIFLNAMPGLDPLTGPYGFRRYWDVCGKGEAKECLLKAELDLKRWLSSDDTTE